MCFLELGLVEWAFLLRVLSHCLGNQPKVSASFDCPLIMNDCWLAALCLSQHILKLGFNCGFLLPCLQFGWHSFL
jgi:hypothetical protein